MSIITLCSWHDLHLLMITWLICWDRVTIRTLVNQLPKTVFTFIHLHQDPWSSARWTPGLLVTFPGPPPPNISNWHLREESWVWKLPFQDNGSRSSFSSFATSGDGLQALQAALLSSQFGFLSNMQSDFFFKQMQLRQLNLPESLQLRCRNSSKMRRKGSPPKIKVKSENLTYTQRRTLQKKLAGSKFSVFSLNKRWKSD